MHIFKYVKCYHKAWKPQSSLNKWILQLQSPDLLGSFWGGGGSLQLMIALPIKCIFRHAGFQILTVKLYFLFFGI